MRLNPPTKLFFLISLVLAILACVVLFSSVSIPIVSAYVTYVLLAAYGVLAASCVLKGV
jgi:predicted PurR-regulated permease PerM